MDVWMTSQLNVALIRKPCHWCAWLFLWHVNNGYLNNQTLAGSTPCLRRDPGWLTWEGSLNLNLQYWCLVNDEPTFPRGTVLGRTARVISNLPGTRGLSWRAARRAMSALKPSQSRSVHSALTWQWLPSLRQDRWLEQTLWCVQSSANTY